MFHTANYPFIIAGPCSIENREQLRSVTETLSSDPRIAMIRCGVWKPRSRPGGFEGLGEVALQWIKELKEEYPQVRFCCEVAQPQHVEQCLRYGIDAVWIGARTSGDPFSMEELCQALQGTQLPVMVKNPTAPDIQLWIGAIERVLATGTSQVAAIHRGFFMRNNIGYRNNPLWEIPIELQRQMPQLHVFCDPSHIGGNRELIPQLMQTAMDLHFEGLMVEVHPQPAEALTDAAQQITPQHLITLLDSLIVRRSDEVADKDLTLLRQQIDQIDRQLIESLRTRMEVSRKIALVKQRNNMTVFQPKRWELVLEKDLALAQQMGLDNTFVKELFEKIHGESVRLQEEALTGNKKEIQ